MQIFHHRNVISGCQPWIFFLRRRLRNGWWRWSNCHIAPCGRGPGEAEKMFFLVQNSHFSRQFAWNVTKLAAAARQCTPRLPLEKRRPTPFLRKIGFVKGGFRSTKIPSSRIGNPTPSQGCLVISDFCMVSGSGLSGKQRWKHSWRFCIIYASNQHLQRFCGTKSTQFMIRIGISDTADKTGYSQLTLYEHALIYFD